MRVGLNEQKKKKNYRIYLVNLAPNRCTIGRTGVCFDHWNQYETIIFTHTTWRRNLTSFKNTDDQSGHFSEYFWARKIQHKVPTDSSIRRKNNRASYSVKADLFFRQNSPFRFPQNTFTADCSHRHLTIFSFYKSFGKNNTAGQQRLDMKSNAFFDGEMKLFSTRKVSVLSSCNRDCSFFRLFIYREYQHCDKCW